MTSKYQVLMTDRAWPNFDLEREILTAIGAELIEAGDIKESTLVELARNVDAIGACWAQVTSKVISAASRCRVISRFGIGLDSICLETATTRGIPVTYVPDYCVEEVSDHALALVLACARKVAFYHQETKSGRYALQQGPAMRRLRGQVLGLVGLGRIARALVPKVQALGLRVVAHTPSGRHYETGCEMVTLDELLDQSDFVSLHAPLSDQTQRIIADAEFRRMKRTAYLINTSRGGLVDHEALLRALEGGRIAGAALDVFDPEPPDLSHPLFRNERVIVTPHAGFLSVESLVELRTRATTHLVQVLQGIRPEHVANPQVFA